MGVCKQSKAMWLNSINHYCFLFAPEIGEISLTRAACDPSSWPQRFDDVGTTLWTCGCAAADDCVCDEWSCWCQGWSCEVKLLCSLSLVPLAREIRGVSLRCGRISQLLLSFCLWLYWLCLLDRDYASSYQLLCFKSKFPNHFAFTPEPYLFLLFWV